METLSQMQHQVIEFYQQNLQLARETGRRRDEMSALASLGRAFDALEERDKAIECYELALKIARDLDDARAERQTLKHLNDVLNPQPVKAQKAAKSSSKTAKPRTAKKRSASSVIKVRKKASKKQPDNKASATAADQQTSSPSRKEK